MNGSTRFLEDYDISLPHLSARSPASYPKPRLNRLPTLKNVIKVRFNEDCNVYSTAHVPGFELLESLTPDTIFCKFSFYVLKQGCQPPLLASFLHVSDSRTMTTEKPPRANLTMKLIHLISPTRSRPRLGFAYCFRKENVSLQVHRQSV